ncbi:MAG: dolichyl-phosphate beta-glucosyltransferase [Gaiellaceae bacterium]
MTPAPLAIVVPVFNEERRLPPLLDALARDADRIVAAAGLELAEVIVVDDASTDRTKAILDAADRLDGRLTVRRLPGRNRGKGAAVREGMLTATAPLALMTDVDLSTPLDDLAALAASIEDGADVAIGSRALRESQVLERQPIYREMMGKAFNVGVRVLTGVPWRDTQCGFKLFRLARARRLFELQRVEGFAFDLDVLVLARRLGLTVREVPVRWVNDPDTHVGLVTSSAQMARDAMRIAYWARRPLPHPVGSLEGRNDGADRGPDADRREQRPV